MIVFIGVKKGKIPLKIWNNLQLKTFFGTIWYVFVGLLALNPLWFLYPLKIGVLLGVVDLPFEAKK